MLRRYLVQTSLVALLGVSILFAAQALAMSPAPAPSTGVQMLPPTDENGNTCVDDPTGTANDTYGILQWDGTSPIRCVKNFFADSSGNLGVGTLTPTYKLDVAGTAHAKTLLLDESITANGGAHLTINRPTITHQGLITFRGSETPYMYGSLGINANRSSFDMLALTPHDLILGTYQDAVNRLDSVVIKPTGYVGIGTSAPATKLDVDGSIRMNQAGVGGRLLGLDPGSAGWPGKELVLTLADGLGTDSDGIWIGPNVSGAAGGRGWVRLHANRIVLTGNTLAVGVGTSNPVSKLDVIGGVKIGADADACVAAKAGTMRYSSALKKMQFCDGTTWQTL